MGLKELNDKLDILYKSPIRKHLKHNHEISLFQDEKVILEEIDTIINISKENLNNPLKVVVLGEVKAGKSTLVNALIGKMVSYTNVIEATASILEIKYSSNEKVIIQQKNGEEISLDLLDELNELMNLNRDNQEFFDKIHKITIFTDIERLKEITLVDTPGLNTVTIENAERTNNYIANADVILWILNSHHLGQSDISEKIEEVLDYGKPIICILNRIDEVNGDVNQLTEYVGNEMGYMFSQIFAVSGKKAWDGHIEKDDSKINESNINELYNYIINNIEANAEQVQQESILESINVQIQRDLYLHKNTKVKIDGMLKRFDEDLIEISEFNNTLKKIVDNKISEWLDMKFFEKEEQLLINCSKEELDNLVKRYCGEEHVRSVIISQYEELNNYILDEWRNNNEEYLSREIQSELAVTSVVNAYPIMATETTDDSNIIEGLKQGGITAGAIGLGLAGYAAWLGPAAAYVTIGSAVSAFFPPLLIAGAIGGGVWKLFGKDKKSINKYNEIERLVFELKSNVESNVVGNMKANLYVASDKYYNNSASMILSILKQCNISKEELECMSAELVSYID